jgi:hypothetical protein
MLVPNAAGTPEPARCALRLIRTARTADSEQAVRRDPYGGKGDARRGVRRQRCRGGYVVVIAMGCGSLPPRCNRSGANVDEQVWRWRRRRRNAGRVLRGQADGRIRGTRHAAVDRGSVLRTRGIDRRSLMWGVGWASRGSARQAAAGGCGIRVDGRRPSSMSCAREQEGCGHRHYTRAGSRKRGYRYATG